MLDVTPEQANDIRDRRIKGFIFDGGRQGALAELRETDDSLVYIPVAGGKIIIASVVQIHPLRQYETYSEKDSFGDLSLYIDRTTGKSMEMTAVELSVRTDAAVDDARYATANRNDPTAFGNNPDPQSLPSTSAPITKTQDIRTVNSDAGVANAFHTVEDGGSITHSIGVSDTASDRSDGVTSGGPAK